MNDRMKLIIYGGVTAAVFVVSALVPLLFRGGEAQAREREKAQAERRSIAARFAQYKRQELKWTAGRRVRPRQREYKPP